MAQAPVLWGPTPLCITTPPSLLSRPSLIRHLRRFFARQGFPSPRTVSLSAPLPWIHPPSLDSSFSPLHPPGTVSPIIVDKLEFELRHFPDRAKAECVIAGLRHGFHLGFNSSSVSLRSAAGNIPSASLQPSVIDSYLQNELVKGRIAGPFPTPPIPDLHISRFGVIPKKHQPGKWRLILDLSSPTGASVIDGNPKDMFSV